MNKVEIFLEKQNKIILEDREKTLISLGIVEKEYSPDGRERYGYSKYDYINGERKYYREIAASVTDEEYEQILSKVKQVEAIKAKEELERQKERSRTSYRMIKKWVPVFEKPKSEWASSNDGAKPDTGNSRMAFILRVVAWIIGVIAMLAGIVIAAATESFLPFLVSLMVGVMEMILLYVQAAMLDYLAELTTIARNGYQYTETTK